MNRRGFLGLLAAVPVAAVIDHDPLARRIFLPPRGGWLRYNCFEPLNEAARLDLLRKTATLKLDMERMGWPASNHVFVWQGDTVYAIDADYLQVSRPVRVFTNKRTWESEFGGRA